MLQSESTLYSCLNAKELLGIHAQNRRNIWSLSDSDEIRTHNLLVRKQTLNHLVKLASLVKWLSVHYELSGCDVRISLFTVWLTN